MTAGAITDVAGIRVGHWTDARALTGCTVVLAEAGAAPGVSVRGGAPGTIETDALRPGATVQLAHAIILTGGSAYGLAAAAGVMRWLEERGVGIRVDRAIVPIVAGAVIFDLLVGDGSVRPGPDAGYAACTAAGTRVEEGRVGAGTGATWGKLRGREHARPGGIGTASVRAGPATVGAIFVVNAVGEVFGEDGSVIGGPIAGDPVADAGLGHTTIGVVATDAALSKADANRLADAAHDGLARAVRPAHLPRDGDTIFALATAGLGATSPVAGLGATPPLADLAAAAADAAERAIRRAARAARG